MKKVFLISCVLFTAPLLMAESISTQIQRELSKQPIFDRTKAKTETLAEMKLDSVPEKMDDLAIVEQATKEAEIIAEQKFSKSQKLAFQKEAQEKYKLVKKGEKITVPIRSGRAYENYTGTFLADNGQKLLIGDKTVLKSDLPEDILARFDQTKVIEMQQKYIQEKFEAPRRTYKAGLISEIKLKIKDRIAKIDVFNDLLSKKESEFKAKKIVSVVGIYCDSKSSEIEKLASAEEKLAKYKELDAELQSVLLSNSIVPDKTRGILTAYDKIRYSILPKLEKEENERITAEKKKEEELASKLAEIEKKEKAEEIQDLLSRIDDMKFLAGKNYSITVDAILSFAKFPNLKNIGTLSALGIYDISLGYGRTRAIMVTFETEYSSLGYATDNLIYYDKIGVETVGGNKLDVPVYIEALKRNIDAYNDAISEIGKTRADIVSIEKNLMSKHSVPSDFLDARSRISKDDRKTNLAKAKELEAFDTDCWDKGFEYSAMIRYVFIALKKKNMKVKDVVEVSSKKGGIKIGYKVILEEGGDTSTPSLSLYLPMDSENPLLNSSKGQKVQPISAYLPVEMERKEKKGDEYTSYKNHSFLFLSQDDFAEYLKAMAE